MLPFVLLIDLDGTIVGDVTDHLNEWIIEGKVTRNKKCSSDYSKTMQWSMGYGLLRPFFKEFMLKALNERHGIEIYIATMSTKDWAPVVIQNIEVLVGKKFNRPLFTRDYFGTDSKGEPIKSLAKLRPHIFNRLKKKYSNLTRESMLQDRMLLIDNTDILLEREYWVRCPTYDFTPRFDILRNLEMSIIRENLKTIIVEMARLNLYKSQSPSLYPPQEFDSFMSHHYARLSRQLHAVSQKNSEFLKDIFWEKCGNFLLPKLFRMLCANNDYANKQYGGGGRQINGLRQAVKVVNHEISSSLK